MKITVKPSVKCSNCGRVTEGVEIRKWLVIRIYICQGCISRFFRDLNKVL